MKKGEEGFVNPNKTWSKAAGDDQHSPKCGTENFGVFTHPYP